MVSGSYNSEPLHEPGVFAGVSPAGFLEDTRYGSRTDHTLSDYHNGDDFNYTTWHSRNLWMATGSATEIASHNSGIFLEGHSGPDDYWEYIGSRH